MPKGLRGFQKGNQFGKINKGRSSNRLGKKMSEQVKEKIRQSLLGHKHTEESKRKMSESRKGKTTWAKDKRWECPQKDIKKERNPNWKGGITELKHRLRTSDKYKQWRDENFERDDYACQYCGDRKGHNLVSHHIIPLFLIIEKIKFEKGIDNLYEKIMDDSLMWDIGNGITLCKKCHKLVHLKTDRGICRPE